jgi:ribulose-phosphate 3-epimerase
MKTTFGASIICMDHLNFERELKFLEEIKIDTLHLDVMDGEFVPRYGIYPEIVEEMSQKSALPMDLHIMTKNPLFTAKQFIDIDNITHISFHINGNEKNFNEISDFVRKNDKLVGIVADLDSNISEISKLISNGSADSVMFMGIVPGVLMQEHQPNKLINNVFQFFKDLKVSDDVFVQADGGVNFETLPKFESVGINNFVCGTSTLFSGRNKKHEWEYNREIFIKNFSKLKSLIKKEK